MVRKKTVKRKKSMRKPKKSALKKGLKKKVSKKKIKKPSKKKVLAVPNGYHSITPYLIMDNANEAINFYKKVFGAKVAFQMESTDGKVRHAELKIGNAKIMLADVYPEMDARSPHSLGGSPVGIHLYIKNVDDIVDKALTAGARLTRPVENMFYGDRSAGLEDPFGHSWYVSTHIEDLSPAKIKKRADEIFKK